MNSNTISGKFELNGYPIYYNEYGTGHEVILLISGSLGSPRYDFRQQLEGPYAFNLKKYTIVAIDLPGWGRSRPPERKYSDKVNELDIDCCLKVMDNLGYKSFSVIGWSEGAKIALAMCHLHPERIKCAVAIAIFIFMSKETLVPILETRDTNLWPKEQLDTFLRIYGNRETVQKLWDNHLGVIKKLRDECDKEYYLATPEQLNQIKTPFLFIHDDKDPIVGVHHSLYCNEHIPGSILHRFDYGSHNCHQVYPAQFKLLVENFIDNCKTIL